MTLFVNYRTYEISDFYIMIITFYVTNVWRKIVTEYLSKQSEEIVKIKDPRGGGIPKLIEDSELGMAILTCSSDEWTYFVKNLPLRKIIFELAKEKIKTDSLVITRNLIRFVVLKLINRNQTPLVRLGNFLSSTDNQIRLGVRLGGEVF